MLFGFPEEPSQWGLKEYIRITAIICAYLLVRPAIQALFDRMGERQRLREKKRHEEEAIKRFKEQRIEERLKQEGKSDADVQKELEKVKGLSTAREDPVTASCRKARNADDSKLEEILANFISDEDVSDLI